MYRKYYCPCPELSFDCPYYNEETDECSIGGNPVELCDDAYWAVGDDEEEEDDWQWLN